MKYDNDVKKIINTAKYLGAHLILVQARSLLSHLSPPCPRCPGRTITKRITITKTSQSLIITGDSPPSSNRLTPLYLHCTILPKLTALNVVPKDSVSDERLKFIQFGESLKVF